MRHFLYAGIRYAVAKVVHILRYHRFTYIPYQRWYIYQARFYGGMTKTFQETGSRLSVEIISRIITSTIEALDEDEELEQLFDAIPGFCRSNVIHDFQLIVDKVDSTLALAFKRLLFRTLTSSFVSEENKKRRVMICVKAVDTAHLSRSSKEILWSIFGYGIDLVLRSVENGQTLRSSGNLNPGLCTRGIIAGVIASVPDSERDDRWMALAMDQQGISEEVL
jgi:hypothetical protein